MKPTQAANITGLAYATIGWVDKAPRTLSRQIRFKSSEETFSGTQFVLQKTCLTRCFGSAYQETYGFRRVLVVSMSLSTAPFNVADTEQAKGTIYCQRVPTLKTRIANATMSPPVLIQ